MWRCMILPAIALHIPARTVDSMDCKKLSSNSHAMGLICYRSIQKETAAQEKAAQAVVAKAKAMAIALQTIGKFIIKKKVGESNQIFGRWAILQPRMQGCGSMAEARGR